MSIYSRQAKYMDRICEYLRQRCENSVPENYVPDGVEYKRKTEYLGGIPYDVVEWEDPLCGGKDA